MPSGITAPIYEGEDVTFEQFVVRCARGLAILGRFREEPLGADLPDSVEPSAYLAQMVSDARKEKDRLRMLTDEQKKAECDAYFDRLQRQHEEALAKAIELRGRYERMLSMARAWHPPTEEHEYLKTYMVKQLEESIKFDCGYTDRDAPKRQPWQQWWKDQVAYADREYAYFVEEFDREVQQCDTITAWVQDLKRSLGMTVSA